MRRRLVEILVGLAITLLAIGIWQFVRLIEWLAG